MSLQHRIRNWLGITQIIVECEIISNKQNRLGEAIRRLQAEAKAREPYNDV